MKNIFKGSVVLMIFSLAVVLFNISCGKESVAQTTTTTSSPQNLGILVFSKSGDKAYEFWTSKYDGTNQTKIMISSIPATAEIIKNTIKLTPDGKKFFFQMNPNPSTSSDAIYSCNADGSGLAKLVDDVDGLSDVK